MELLNIDGTMVAVILNFLILLWILNHFLYKPVLKVLEDRKMYVESTINLAEGKLQDAAGLKAELEKKLSEAKGEAQALIDEALKTSERIRHELTQDGRAEATTIRERAMIEVERMREQVGRDLRSDVVDLALEAAGKILERTLDEAENRKYAEKVIAQIQAKK
ncbi:MAG: F0F1 ATP synthase subunit B [bacterium]